MKEAYLYKKLRNKTAQCQTCAHYCVLRNAERGICGVRENKDGKIYSLAYGKACAVNIDPIEKKPFFHFLSGSQSLSIATVGCNFRCDSCQNWAISQGPKIFDKIEGEQTSPAQIVEITLKNKLPSISYTYTEPSVFLEYALDTMKLAKKTGLKNCWVTNGFLSKETAELIIPYLDAANVDLKSFDPSPLSYYSNHEMKDSNKGEGFDDKFYQKYCGGRLQPVLDTLKRLKKAGIWIEVTTLIIPGLSDSEKMFGQIAHFIKKELGAETPWHISRFCGTISWKLRHLPDTPVEALKRAWEIGKEAGLKYVYTGNVPGLENEDTFCPKCKTKMINRLGYNVTRYDKNGKCSKCGENLNIIE